MKKDDIGLKYRLLLIDDDDSFLTTTKIALERIFTNVEATTIGQTGIPGKKEFISAGDNALDYYQNILSGKYPIVHCVFIDNNMFGMNGLDLLKEILKLDPYAPVVMLTGDEEAMGYASIDCFDYGAKGYLFKTSRTFYGEVYITIQRVSLHTVRERWLKILSKVGALDREDIPDLSNYASKVLSIYDKYFPRTLGFIREYNSKTKQYELLDACNLEEQTRQKLLSINFEKIPFAKKAIEKGEPTFDNEAFKWPKERFGIVRDLGLKMDQTFFIPMFHGSEPVGTISFYNALNIGRFFYEEEKGYAQTLAQMVSAYIFMFRYKQKLVNEIVSISSQISVFNICKEEKCIYECLVKHIHEKLNLHPINKKKNPNSKTTLKDVIPGTDTLEIAHSEGVSRDVNVKFSVKVAATGKSRLVIDKTKELEWITSHPDMTSSVTVPLFNESGRVMAVLNAENSNISHFDNDDLKYAETLANIAASYVTRLKMRKFLDEILKVVGKEETSDSYVLLKRVLKIIKEYTGYRAIFVVLKAENNNIVPLTEGYDKEEEEGMRYALTGQHDPKNPPLPIQGLLDNKEYQWNKSDKDQSHKPWFPSEQMHNEIKSQYIFLFRLQTGEPFGVFSMEFLVEHALDELQFQTIRQILPLISRLLFSAEEFSHLKKESQMLQIQASFTMSLRQISHELNDIAFQIKSRVDFMLDNDELPEFIREDLLNIKNSADDITKLKAKLRGMTRELKIKKIIIENVWDKTRHKFEDKLTYWNIKVSPEIEVGLIIDCDEILLETVIYNLIDNAIEAINSIRKKGDGEILFIGKDKGETVNLYIEDNGPGIKGITQDEAFSWFGTTSSTGTGFGLPFSRYRLNQIGGKLHYRASQRLSGACFEIILKKGG